MKQIDSDNMWSGPMAIHPDFFAGDNSEAQRLLRMCEATYDCDEGPGETEEDVVKGLIRKRTVRETVPTCGLPDEYFKR